MRSPEYPRSETQTPTRRRTRGARPGRKSRSHAHPPRRRAAPRTRPSPGPREARLRPGSRASLRVRLGGEARRAFGEKRPRMEDAVGAKVALDDDGDPWLEDVRQGAGVLHGHRCAAVLLRERHMQRVALSHVVLHHARHANTAWRCTG